MRLGLLIVALASASPAAAQMAGDRYGDRSPTAAVAAIGASYEGPTLSWSRKTQPAPPVAAADPRAPSRPEPLALANQFRAGGLPPAPRIERGPEPRAYQPFQPQTPIPLQWSAPKANLPGTLYDAPPPAQQIAAAPPPAPAAQPQPMRLAAVAPSPALLGGPPATVASTPRGAGGATRLYSVHRGYGLTPDAIPQQPGGDRYVLIGPPDAGVQASPKPDDDGPDDSPGVF